MGSVCLSQLYIVQYTYSSRMVQYRFLYNCMITNCTRHVSFNVTCVSIFSLILTTKNTAHYVIQLYKFNPFTH